MARSVAGRVAALAACALTVAGCGSSVTASPTPSIEIHILNEISNAVIFQGGPSVSPIGTPPPLSQGVTVVRPCGGQADIPVTAGTPDHPMHLGMAVDTTGQLDGALAATNYDITAVPDAAISRALVMWSSGEISQSAWLTISPTEVVQSFTPTPQAASLGECAPWAFGPRPPASP